MRLRRRLTPVKCLGGVQQAQLLPQVSHSQQRVEAMLGDRSALGRPRSYATRLSFTAIFV
jgi:hypothetical protein